jgi:hypothetical protein
VNLVQDLLPPAAHHGSVKPRMARCHEAHLKTLNHDLDHWRTRLHQLAHRRSAS